MPFDESIKGDPFRGVFPEWAGEAGAADAAAAVHRQAADLEQLRYHPAIRHHLLRSIQRRRQRPDGHADDTVTQFEFLAAEDGTDHLHVPGELLITGHSYDGRHMRVNGWGPEQYAKPYLDALGMEPAAVDCPALRDRVVRLIHPGMGHHELADLARALRARGFAASLSAVTPTAPVTKGIGGPAPAPSPGAFQRDEGPGPRAKVAIIDTGIADQPRTDGWLQHIPGDKDQLDTFPPPHGDSYLDADAGHGTFIAGIVQQVAPGAQITAYRAVDSDGIASEMTVACEMIRAVTEDGAHIVNLSLGCHTPDDVPPIAIQAALDYIRHWKLEHDRQVVIVAAAGNYGDTRPCWPAAFRDVVSVGALTPGMHASPWSTRGFWVRCSTIGQGLRSTYVSGKESLLLTPSPYEFEADPWGAWSGTSFAAAQVAGAVAQIYEERACPVDEALRLLLSAGRPVPQFGQAVKILPGA
jgi:Subtilase family